MQTSRQTYFLQHQLRREWRKTVPYTDKQIIKAFERLIARAAGPGTIERYRNCIALIRQGKLDEQILKLAAEELKRKLEVPAPPLKFAYQRYDAAAAFKRHRHHQACGRRTRRK
jgi:hypothetical protein